MNRLPPFVKDAGERLAKTFFQFYIASWMFAADVISTDMIDPNTSAGAFDTLFTVDNLKAGVVGMALSLGTSILSKTVGNKESASLVE